MFELDGVDKSKPTGLIGLCRRAFSLPGESLQQFSAGYNKLTDKDKQDLKSWFEAEGFIVEPLKLKSAS